MRDQLKQLLNPFSATGTFIYSFLLSIIFETFYQLYPLIKIFHWIGIGFISIAILDVLIVISYVWIVIPVKNYLEYRKTNKD